MPQFNDDSDMKIVGAPPKQGDEINTSDFLAMLGQQHFNGNYAKARTLGANIVSAFSYRAPPEELMQFVREAGVRPEEPVLLQVKILSVFSAEFCLNKYLPSPLMSGVAVDEMYDVLQRILPEFYETLSHSTAFSFYYLAAKAESGVSRRIGEQFASLCGRGGDETVIALGESLHRMNVDAYKKAIRSFAFV